MNEYGSLVTWQYDIRPPVQVPHVKPIPEACCVQETTYCQLRPGILPPDVGHHAGSFGLINPIHLSFKVFLIIYMSGQCVEHR